MKKELLLARWRVVSGLKDFILGLTVLFAIAINVEKLPKLFLIVGLFALANSLVAIVQIVLGVWKAVFETRLDRPTAGEYQLQKETIGLAFLVVPAFALVVSIQITIAFGVQSLSRGDYYLVGASVLAIAFCGGFFYRGRRPPEHVLKQR